MLPLEFIFLTKQNLQNKRDAYTIVYLQCILYRMLRGCGARIPEISKFSVEDVFWVRNGRMFVSRLCIYLYIIPFCSRYYDWRCCLTRFHGKNASFRWISIIEVKYCMWWALMTYLKSILFDVASFRSMKFEESHVCCFYNVFKAFYTICMQISTNYVYFPVLEILQIINNNRLIV